MLKILGILFLVQLIFSAWPVLVKLVLEEGSFHVLLLGLYKDLCGSICLLSLVYSLQSEQNSERERGLSVSNNGDNSRSKCACISSVRNFLSGLIHPEEKRLFLFLGVCACINSVGYIYAISLVSPFNSALLHPTIPVFASILGACTGVEKLTMRKVTGSVICIVGSLFVILSQGGTVGDSLTGNLLLLLQSFAMASLLVGQKFVSDRHSPLHTTAVYYSIGTVLSIPCILLLLSFDSTYEGARAYLSVTSILVVLFGGVFVISFNYAGLTWANLTTSPAIPASSMMLQPPLTYLLQDLFGQGQDGEQSGQDILQIAGASIIIAGLLLAVTESEGVGNTPYNILEKDPQEAVSALHAGVGDDLEDTKFRNGFYGSVPSDENDNQKRQLIQGY